ncbi:Golgi reassembly-stacking protein 1-like isoform X1 [Pundamilia nyererei]|uniref:Golgi reassembly-stacking protein 1-like isoform X1 n=1 Tax=Pundamilia nyererei TaxID=303518 RepID=A0A9Y3QL27_9CICH|nr:PREDICTED: Golgi reassembly-stacking protein 1-like isoform X1 [Pundamilia nyererei]
MGLPQSSLLSDGGANCGYHVHGVQEDSPALKAGLEPFFDFILSIGNARLNKENDLLKDLLKANVEKAVKLEVYNSKTQRVRELEVTPSNMWGGQGLLGASVRFCSFEGANENVWHVLEVEPNSPAALAGLDAYNDFIVGADQVLQDSEDFFSLIEANEGKPLKLLVYNTKTDQCREVVVTPNGAWGGEGSLGCGIGYGYLHRIPTRPVQPNAQNKNVLQPVLTGSSEEVVATEHTEVKVPSTDECSPSTEAALNQSEKSMQDQSLISPTQQPPDRDAFTILDAPTSDLSATVSTNEEGSSSMFANYGDDSGDQSSLDYSSFDQRPSFPEKQGEPDIQEAEQKLGIDLTASTSPIRETAEDMAGLKITTENPSITTIAKVPDANSEPLSSIEVVSEEMFEPAGPGS